MKYRLGSQTTQPKYSGSSVSLRFVGNTQDSQLVVGSDPTFSNVSWSTEQTIGSGTYSTLQAIGRWNTVQWQDLTVGQHAIGIVAFHHEGIDRVEFVANGGNVTTVSSPSLNPQTGSMEYWTYLQITDDLADEIEIRARIYPTTGLTRTLAGDFETNVVSNIVSGNVGIGNGEYSLICYPETSQTSSRQVAYVATTGSDSTGDGTEGNPYATIGYAVWNGLGGGTQNVVADKWEIRLAAGEYKWDSSSYGGSTPVGASTIVWGNRWLTIVGPDWSGDYTQASGRPSAIIIGEETGGAPGQIVEQNWDRLHFQNVGFEIPPSFYNDTSQTKFWQGGGDLMIWFDRCFVNGGLNLQAVATAGDSWMKPDNVTFESGSKVKFFTDCVSYETNSRPLSGEITRGCTLDGIYGDAFGTEGIVDNCTARRVYRTLYLEEQGDSIDLPLDASGNPDVAAYAHPDVTQIRLPGGTIENHIFQDVVATDQVQCEGIFLSGTTSLFRDCAFVRFQIDNGYQAPAEPSATYYNLMLYDPLTHVLFLDGQVDSLNSNYDAAALLNGQDLDVRATFNQVLVKNVSNITSGNFTYIHPDGLVPYGNDGRTPSSDFQNEIVDEWYSDGTQITYRH